MDYEFDAPLWVSDAGAAGSWTFLSVPTDLADEILEAAAHAARGFGSVRVEATIGTTTWHTSLFPDSKRGTYILPVKAAVRRAAAVDDGDVARVRLVLRDV